MITKITNSIVHNLDPQMILLNVASVASIVAESMTTDSNRWAVGFLIVTIGILNLAKAYSTIKKGGKE